MRVRSRRAIVTDTADKALADANINRRRFLQLFGVGVATQAIPFNRVWSFPSQIVIPHRTYLVGQYAMFSDLPFYAIDGEVAKLASEISYRLALTVNSLVAATA